MQNPSSRKQARQYQGIGFGIFEVLPMPSGPEVLGNLDVGISGSS